MYTLLARGEYFRVNDKGHIAREGSKTFSGDWILYAIVPKWNMKPWAEYQWPELVRRMEHGGAIQGYIYDRDHGTLRFWGGSYQGKLPKGKIWKD